MCLLLCLPSYATASDSSASDISTYSDSSNDPGGEASGLVDSSSEALASEGIESPAGSTDDAALFFSGGASTGSMTPYVDFDFLAYYSGMRLNTDYYIIMPPDYYQSSSSFYASYELWAFNADNYVVNGDMLRISNAAVYNLSVQAPRNDSSRPSFTAASSSGMSRSLYMPQLVWSNVPELVNGSLGWFASDIFSERDDLNVLALLVASALGFVLLDRIRRAMRSAGTR